VFFILVSEMLATALLPLESKTEREQERCGGTTRHVGVATADGSVVEKGVAIQGA
jgi:hypothetical protein